MSEIASEVLQLAATQYNLVSRRQLNQLGINAHAIARRVNRNQWQEITPRVIKLSLGALTRKEELFAATLHHENLALTGVAALEILGLETNHDQRIDLIGPRGTRVEPFLNAVLHTSRRDFSVEVGAPLRTCHSLSVVYAMAWAKSLKQAQHYAYWSIREGHITLFELCDTAFSNRHSSLMKKALPRVLTIREHVDTVTEHQFVKLVEKFEIRGLVFKPEFLLADGTPIHPDFGIRVGDEMLAVEIDGVHHETEENRSIDAFRMKVFRSYGVETFRATNADVKNNGDAVMRALRFRIDRMRRAA